MNVYRRNSVCVQVYWADTGVGAISRAYLNGTWQEIVFAHRDIGMYSPPFTQVCVVHRDTCTAYPDTGMCHI